MKPPTLRACFATASTAAVAAALLMAAPAAHAGTIIPTVALGTAGQYSVLAGQTVTNTGNSTLNASLGVHPGSAVAGFPPGLVNAPGTIHAGDAVALQAKSDLTAAYGDAAGRGVDQTGPADLTGLSLQAGTYAASSKGALLLTGGLVLDGAGDPNSVFIFQTDSTLITGSGSTVTLINGAQECNIFWQIGSSATLGSGSNFAGNILALTSVSVNNSVTVHGRALAQTGSVTLDNDTFVAPTCDMTSPVATTAASTATTTVDQPATTAPGGATVGGGTVGGGTVAGDTIAGDTVGGDIFLPRTGRSNGLTLTMAAATLVTGTIIIRIARRKTTPMT